MAKSRKSVKTGLASGNRELLTYLGQLCITPGSHFIVIDKALFDGPITVEVNGEHIVVGYQAARHVFVEAA